jgi:hypothetical protein
LHRLGQAKRLVFMARLAVTDQPESERALHHGKRVIGEGASFKSGEELLGKKKRSEVRGQREK